MKFVEGEACMCLVSVIIPLYKGNKYIENIVHMLEMNVKHAKVSLELIFVNDYPEERVDNYESSDIRIKCFTNICNKGIHFSRVNGLKNANGEYILFLDQDDQIEDLFIKSQLEKIGFADVVVCNGTSSGKIIYENINNQKRVGDIEAMVNGNQIISPGQALIKRESIPCEWMENILINNFSDDYFLWLLMLCQDKKIVLNHEVLYHHIYTGENTSLNREKMYKSVNELLDYFERWNYLNQEQITQIRKKSFEVSGKYFSYTKILDMWMHIIEKGSSLERILINKGYKTIAVYGLGILGKHLVKQLRMCAVEVKYIIDRNKFLTCDDIKVITAGAEMQEVDAVIVTPVNEYEEIETLLKQFYCVDIISLEALLREELYLIK